MITDHESFHGTGRDQRGYNTRTTGSNGIWPPDHAADEKRPPAAKGQRHRKVSTLPAIGSRPRNQWVTAGSAPAFCLRRNEAGCAERRTGSAKRNGPSASATAPPGAQAYRLTSYNSSTGDEWEDHRMRRSATMRTAPETKKKIVGWRLVDGTCGSDLLFCSRGIWYIKSAFSWRDARGEDGVGDGGIRPRGLGRMAASAGACARLRSCAMTTESAP